MAIANTPFQAGCMTFMAVGALVCALFLGVTVAYGIHLIKSAATDLGRAASWQFSPSNPAPTLWESWRAENPSTYTPAAGEHHHRHRHVHQLAK